MTRLPDNVSSRTTVYGEMSVAQIRTLYYATRNVEDSLLRVGIEIREDKLRRTDGILKYVVAKFDSGVALCVGLTGRVFDG